MPLFPLKKLPVDDLAMERSQCEPLLMADDVHNQGSDGHQARVGLQN